VRAQRLRLMPALNIEAAEVNLAIEALDDCVR
jgi:hypothetical protein